MNTTEVQDAEAVDAEVEPFEPIMVPAPAASPLLGPSPLDPPLRMPDLPPVARASSQAQPGTEGTAPALLARPGGLDAEPLWVPFPLVSLWILIGLMMALSFLSILSGAIWLSLGG